MDALLEARSRVEHFLGFGQFQTPENKLLGVERARPVFIGAGNEEFGAAEFFAAEQGGLRFGADGGQTFAQGDFVGPVASAGEEERAFDGDAELTGLLGVEDAAAGFRGEPEPGEEIESWACLYPISASEHFRVRNSFCSNRRH